ncbi:hypothetical protein [Burkholderia sp. LMG 21824]|uniref:hypothetical protein n=1 Tax=Burkholderia sp. LMG 21824 TaxID=3158172 RepID=UPI003C2E08B8
MQVLRIIKEVGGRPAIVRLTGLHVSLISHWIKQDYIPSHWIRFFIALKPELDWPELLDGNTLEYTDLMNHEHVIRTRLSQLSRLRKRVKKLQAVAAQIVPADELAN